MIDVELEADLVMAVPPWTEAPGSAAQKSIDVGHRHEQLFTATGTLRVGGKQLDFTATGLRIWRLGVRTMSGFDGHCWQVAVFPSGKAFGYTALPDRPGAGPGYRAGFVFDGERAYPATATEVPWLSRFEPEGGDVAVELRSELGVHVVSGRTTTSSVVAGRAALATVAALNSGMAGRDLFLHQGGAHYTWDGESCYGMVERSAANSEVRR